MKPCVFIQCNEQQLIGAKVAVYSLRRHSRAPDAFDIRIMMQEDYPFFAAHEGKPFLRREGLKEIWRNDYTQGFAPLRFAPPELMGYEGRALVTDPDVFAVGDVYDLLSRDMEGKSILCHWVPPGGDKEGYYATSVMLLDCAQLTHWKLEADFDQLFTFEREYHRWIHLLLEPKETIGELEEEWNHFDTLTPKTKLLHNTRRRTQPWRTGLPVDFGMRDATVSPWRRMREKLFGPPPTKTYDRHPDPNQERFFFGLLRDMLDEGVVTEAYLRQEIARGWLRPDVFEMLRPASAVA